MPKNAIPLRPDCSDLRPKGRGRPQRILLGVWPDEHIRGVIRAVVFRDGHSPHMVKEEPTSMYPSLANYAACNGPEGAVSPGAAAAAAVAAVAQGTFSLILETLFRHTFRRTFTTEQNVFFLFPFAMDSSRIRITHSNTRFVETISFSYALFTQRTPTQNLRTL